MWEMVRVFLAGAKAVVRAHFKASSLQGGGLEDGQGLGPGRQLRSSEVYLQVPRYSSSPDSARDRGITKHLSRNLSGFFFLSFWGPVICLLANPEMRLNLCLTKEAPGREGERHRDRQGKLCRGCWAFFLFCLLGRILPLCLRGAVRPPENMTLYFLPLFVNTPHYHPSQFHVTASRH